MISIDEYNNFLSVGWKEDYQRFSICRPIPQRPNIDFALNIDLLPGFVLAGETLLNYMTNVNVQFYSLYFIGDNLSEELLKEQCEMFDHTNIIKYGDYVHEHDFRICTKPYSTLEQLFDTLTPAFQIAYYEDNIIMSHLAARTYKNGCQFIDADTHITYEYNRQVKYAMEGGIGLVSQRPIEKIMLDAYCYTCCKHKCQENNIHQLSAQYYPIYYTQYLEKCYQIFIDFGEKILPYMNGELMVKTANVYDIARLCYGLPDDLIVDHARAIASRDDDLIEASVASIKIYMTNALL